MRRWIVLCAVIVSQISLRAEESKVTTKRLMIQLSTVNALRPRCGPTPSKVYACTQFVGPRLSAPCSSEDDAWKVRPRAEFVALIYIVDHTFIHHELLHIRDMEKALNLYLARLETRRFSNPEGCALAAKAEAAKFSERMKAFADQSNGQRH